MTRGSDLYDAIMAYKEAYKMRNTAKMKKLEKELARHNVDHEALLEITNSLITAEYNRGRK